MSSANRVRLTVSISQDTVDDLRSMLGEKAARRGEVSKYIKQALLNQMMIETMRQSQEHNRGVEPELLEREIDEALQDVRLERSMRRQNAPACD